MSLNLSAQRPLARAVSLVLLSACAATQAEAQSVPAASTSVEEVVVTGSMIRRTDAETPSPVSILTAEDLVKSGYTDVSEVLRNLTANGQGTLSQSFAGAFAGGGSGVALRGLTVGATLTLVDSQRMVAYPLSDDGQRSFVDVSAIPFNAVERIEVLKDGASAEYGSDAIAGVVNVILKKTYEGAEATAEGGTSKYGDGTTEHVSGIFGRGDLAHDGYNFYVAAEFRHQDQIRFFDRHGGFTNLDWTAQGGLNRTPGAYIPDYNPYPASVTGYLLDPSTGAIGAALPGCTLAQLTASQCTFRTLGLQLQPTSENINVLSKYTVRLGGDWQFVATGSFFRSQAQQSGGIANTGAPGGLFGIHVGPGVNPTLPANEPIVITVPGNYPGNPYGVAAPLVYSFRELGAVYTEFSTDTYRLFGELKGTWRGWDVDANAGAMLATTHQLQHGLIDPVRLQAALNAGYVLGSSTGTSLFAPPVPATEYSKLQVVDVRATRGVMELPGGTLSFGTGVDYQHRDLDALASQACSSGTVANCNNAFAVGTQNNLAVFAEVVAPIVQHLELDGAVRYDHYDTYGHSVTPKFGFKYSPFSALALRGTWGEGFRAPNPAETGNAGQSYYLNTGPDSALCPNGYDANGNLVNPTAAGNFPSQCAVGFQYYQRSNPNLQPVKSKSYTLGVVIEPSNRLNVSVDYYDIRVSNDIVAGPGDFANPARGPAVTLPYCTADGQCTSTANTGTVYGVGPILYVPATYINANSTHTSGVDIDLKTRIDLGEWGRLTGDLNVTQLLHYQLTVGASTYELAGTHGPLAVSGDTGNPKSRAALSLTWERSSLSLTGTVNYIGAFAALDPSVGQQTCADAQYQSYATKFLSGQNFPASACTVDHFTDVDVYGKWTVGEHLSVHGSVLNLFNRAPPLDYTTYGGTGAYNPSFHQAGAVGRYFNLGATYRF